MLPSINFLLLLVPIAIGNSEQEKWSWPEKHKDLKSKADNRRDIYFENFEQHSGRIRVPTSHDDNKRPFQAYQASVNIKSKPLSDEFSDESGENYSNNINGGGGFNNNRKPNRQQSDGFSQFGNHQGQQGQLPFGGVGGGQFYQQGGPASFPGQGINGFGHGGFPNYNNFNPALQQGQGFSPIHSQGIGAFGNNFGGFPSHNLNLQNGILVGPGGPTGIIGRPYGGQFNQFQGYGNQFQGHGGFNGGGFNAHGAIGAFPQGIGGGGIFHDSTNNNQNKHQNFKRVEKSIS